MSDSRKVTTLPPASVNVRVGVSLLSEPELAMDVDAGMITSTAGGFGMADEIVPAFAEAERVLAVDGSGCAAVIGTSELEGGTGNTVFGLF